MSELHTELLSVLGRYKHDRLHLHNSGYRPLYQPRGNTAANNACSTGVIRSYHEGKVTDWFVTSCDGITHKHTLTITAGNPS